MIKKAYAEISKGQCHYRYKLGRGIPIVFLHQTPSSSLMYEKLISELPESSCFAIDTPGFGMSDDIAGSPNIEDYGNYILEVLDSLEIKEFHLMGHHSGASIALFIENQCSDLVQSLTLIGVFLATTEEKETMKKQTGLDWSPREDGKHLINAWNLAGEILGAGDDLDLRQRETVDAIRAEESAKQMHDAIWNFSEIDALTKTNTPSLILCSEDDVMYPFLNKAKDCKPEVIVEIIKGKNLEPDLDSENIASHLKEFLKNTQNG